MNDESTVAGESSMDSDIEEEGSDHGDEDDEPDFETYEVTLVSTPCGSELEKISAATDAWLKQNIPIHRVEVVPKLGIRHQYSNLQITPCYPVRYHCEALWSCSVHKQLSEDEP